MKSASGVFITIIGLLSIAGCAVKQAQTAQEFRQMIPHDSYGHQVTITVNKPYTRVLHNFRKRTDVCLKKDVVMTTKNQYGATMNKQTLAYTPTLVADKARAELSVQLNITGGGMIAGKVPKNGMYILVADIMPAGKSKTKLAVYRNAYYGVARIEASIKDWTTGKTLACPDMTK